MFIVLGTNTCSWPAKISFVKTQQSESYPSGRSLTEHEMSTHTADFSRSLHHREKYPERQWAEDALHVSNGTKL